MLLLIALFAQDATVKVTPAPPPPPIVTIAPPMMVPALREKVPAFPVQVKITAGKQVLLQDKLLVDTLNGASATQSRSEAAPENCPNEYRYYGTPTTGLSLRINRRDSANPALLNVSVNWSRPTAPATCTSYGTRTVMINQTVELPPGKSVWVEGDSGLVVELSR